MSDFLQCHRLLPCPSLSSRVCPTSTEWVMLSNHLIFCHSLLLSPSVFPSIRVFYNKLALQIRWPKYWASASVFPMNIQDRFPLGLTGLISLLSSLQHHSSKPSILQHSAFFMVQLSHPHMTTEKNVVLTTRTFVGKVMSLLFNTLSRFVIAFIPRASIF